MNKLILFIIIIFLCITGCTQESIDDNLLKIKVTGGVISQVGVGKNDFKITVNPNVRQLVIQKDSETMIIKLTDLQSVTVQIIFNSELYKFSLVYDTSKGYANPTGVIAASNYQDIKIKSNTMKRATLPLAYSLPNLPPVFDQKTLSSCVSCTLAYTKTWQEGKERNWSLFDDSQYFSGLYFFNQVNGGNNIGTSYPDNLEIAKKGAALLSLFQYSLDFLKQPDASVISDAYKYRIVDYSRVEINENSIKSMLVSGYPVMITLKIYCPQFWLDPIYDFQNINILSVDRGYHAITIVGYDDAKKSFIFANSWGNLWNENGFGRIDYESVKNFVIEAYVAEDYIEKTAN